MIAVGSTSHGFDAKDVWQRYKFTESLKALLAANLEVFAAAICSISPVLGLHHNTCRAVAGSVSFRWL